MLGARPSFRQMVVNRRRYLQNVLVEQCQRSEDIIGSAVDDASMGGDNDWYHMFSIRTTCFPRRYMKWWKRIHGRLFLVQLFSLSFQSLDLCLLDFLQLGPECLRARFLHVGGFFWCCCCGQGWRLRPDNHLAERPRPYCFFCEKMEPCHSRKVVVAIHSKSSDRNRTAVTAYKRYYPKLALAECDVPVR